MRTKHQLLLPMLLCGGLLAQAGCGSETSEPEPQRISVALPNALPLMNCTQRTALGTALEAVLDIGGHDPCPLSIDPSTLVATGSCERITIGIVRPLGLRYGYKDPGNASVALGYLLGFVDLRVDVLSSDATSVAVNLDPTTGAAKLLSTDADVAALRSRSACVDMSEVEVNLCTAEAWAKNRFENDVQIDFDANDNGQNNLTEACNGTLLP